MIDAKIIYDKVVTLQALDLIVNVDVANIDELIVKLQELKEESLQGG